MGARMRRWLRDKRGYALVTVLCILLLFSALGVNALVAANATMGAAAAQQADAQAYALAASAVPQVQGWVEGGAFTPLIQEQLLDAVAAAYTEEELAAFPGRRPPVSAQASAPVPLPGGRSATLSLRFELEKAHISGGRATGTLRVRIRAEYGQVGSAFAASYALRYEADGPHFQQLSVQADRIREGE